MQCSEGLWTTLQTLQAQAIEVHTGVIFHDLRRTIARKLRRAGIAEGAIMRIGGWKTRSVFERYAIVTRSDIADAILKLQQTEKVLSETIETAIGHAARRATAPCAPRACCACEAST